MLVIEEKKVLEMLKKKLEEGTFSFQTDWTLGNGEEVEVTVTIKEVGEQFNDLLYYADAEVSYFEGDEEIFFDTWSEPIHVHLEDLEN